jgi:ABC-type Zn uptake system ZnuABC Zn-binding protein ZnuA
VEVETLAGAAAGCLHDYQLSPADRITVERADVVLLNGAGAEPFLEDVVPADRAVDTSAGLELLCSDHGHDHGHDHDHGEHTAYNEHLWTSPRRYGAQIRAVPEALCRLNPDAAASYRRNGEAYRQQVLDMGARLRAAAGKLPSGRCVIFHDSLAYLADDLGLEVALALTVGEDSGVSAGDLSAVQRLVQQDPGLLLLYDDQYTVRYNGVDRLVPTRQVVAMDTAVTGTGQLTDWLDAMEHNLALLERITEG